MFGIGLVQGEDTYRQERSIPYMLKIYNKPKSVDNRNQICESKEGSIKIDNKVFENLLARLLLEQMLSGQLPSKYDKEEDDGTFSMTTNSTFDRDNER